jgi:tRNA G18 (ribose-2'-O)-methylase SpoU
MPTDRIAGPGDPRVADYRDVAERDLVSRRGLFIAEGRLVLRRLIETGRYELRSVLVNEASYRQLEAMLSAVADRVPIYICRTDDFLGITGHDFHRGCLAMVERPRDCSVGDVLSAPNPHRTVVVLEGVTDADNIGGVFRNAAAFTADAVLLSPTCSDPLYRKAIRTSMAATLRVPFARFDTWPSGLSSLRASGFTVVALTLKQPSITIDEFVSTQRTTRIALLVGTESEGLTADAEAGADIRVHIPIARDVDSLNLAVAVGIALHRLASRITGER